MKRCCFTGHRNVNVTVSLKRKLADEIRRLVDAGVTDFYAGGAMGWDMLCEQAVLSLKNTEYSHIRLHLVLPCPPDEQTRRWNQRDKELFLRIMEKADSSEVMFDRYFNGCMKERNRRLAENADICICYYNPADASSGTGQTVRLCEGKGIPVVNLFETQKLF